MDQEKVYQMPFTKVYQCLLAKAERKGRSQEEVYDVTSWLTGYSSQEIEKLMSSDLTYGDFFRNAPMMNPDRKLIKGSICGIHVENIEEPLMQDIRYLDKLIDELVKGKTVEKIKRS